MSTKDHHLRHAFVASSIAALMMAIMIFVFSVFEQAIGHGIAIASFAATTAIVVFNPTNPSARPKTIVFSYLGAALIGFLVSLSPFSLSIQAALAVGLIIAILIITDTSHPPAVAYAFGFILGGYGLTEFILTIPALLAFFVALATTAFVVERIATLLGLIEDPKIDSSKLSYYQKIERAVDNAVPYALVILFVAIVVEFVYADQVAPYSFYFNLIDWAVILFFVLDLSFKFRKVPKLKDFMRKYWLDIIATIPFFIVFRFFQGLAVAFEVFSRGGLEVTRHMAIFVRFLRPLARFPRFARMLKHLEKIYVNQDSKTS